MRSCPCFHAGAHECLGGSTSRYHELKVLKGLLPARVTRRSSAAGGETLTLAATAHE